MERDDPVEEIRAFRDEYARRFNYDLRAMCRDLKERQSKNGRQSVTLPSRKVIRIKRGSVAASLP
jgi:hypothetical protein